MSVHKILLGAQAGTFLPFALSRLQYMQDNDPEGVGSEKYLLNGYRIEIQQLPPVIRIIGGGELYFEFVTSGVPIELEEPLPGIEAFKGVFVGVSVKDEKGVMTHSAVIKGNKRAEHQVDTSGIQRQYQVDMINEPVIQLNKKGLFESWAPFTPHNGIFLRGVEQCRGHTVRDFRGPLMAHMQRDTGFDVPHSYNVRSENVINSYVRGNSDWPRSSGLQEVVKVENDGSERRVIFAIQVDAFDQVAVYPITQIGPNVPPPWSQNVEEKFVRRAKVNFPAWAHVATSKAIDTQPPPGVESVTRLLSQPETDWKVNHLGTMMCAVVYHRAPFEYDTEGPWTVDPSSTPMHIGIFNELTFAMGPQSRDYAEIGPGEFPDRYFIAPGLVEVAIKIELTGPEPEDFSLELVTRIVRDARTDEFCTVVAGYSWIDIANADGTPKVAKGDLITFDVETYIVKPSYESGGWQALYERLLATNPSVLPMTQGYWVVRNITKRLELKCMYQQPLLAIDMPTLSFVTQASPRDYDYHNEDDGLYRYRHATAIFVRMELQDVVFPEIEYPQRYKDEIMRLINEPGRERLAACAEFYATVGFLEYIKLNDPDRDKWDRGAEWLAFRILWAMGTTTRFCHYGFYGANTHDNDGRFFIPWDGGFGGGNPCDRYRELDYDQVPANDPKLLQGVFEDFEYRYGRIGFGDNEGSHMMLAKVPYWGRYAYGIVIADLLHCCSTTTFYTHPNGSWCYFDNHWLYDDNGRRYDQSLAWTTDKLEQVIVDRIHLVAPQSKGVFKASFRELYNQAVQKILDAPDPIPPEPPKPNLQLMQKSHLRASFQKLLLGPQRALQIQATWDGAQYWKPDAQIWDGSFPPDGLLYPPGIDAGGTTSLSMNHSWYTGPALPEGFGASGTPSQDSRHVRICDPILFEK